MKLFSEETLIHYGIQGQKKGVRRWQNEDGTFNEAGKERYFGKLNNNIQRLEKIKNKLEANQKKWEKKYEQHKSKVDEYDSRLILNKLLPFKKTRQFLRNVHKWREQRNFVKQERAKRKIENITKKIEVGQNKLNEFLKETKYKPKNK